MAILWSFYGYLLLLAIFENIVNNFFLSIFQAATDVWKQFMYFLQSKCVFKNPQSSLLSSILDNS